MTAVMPKSPIKKEIADYIVRLFDIRDYLMQEPQSDYKDELLGKIFREIKEAISSLGEASWI